MHEHHIKPLDNLISLSSLNFKESYPDLWARFATLNLDPREPGSVPGMSNLVFGIPDPDDLASRYGVRAASNSNFVKTFNDARVIGDFDPHDYEGMQIKVSKGKHAEDKKWTSHELGFINLLNNLTIHKEGLKDGQAFLYGEMVPGQRFGKSVIACTGLAVDFDNGIPNEEVLAKAKKTGCFFIHHSTHSNGCIRTDFPKDHVLRYRADVDAVDTEVMRDYLLNKKKWDPRMVATVECDGEDQNEKGIVVWVKHKPMDKSRVIFFLKEPFVMRDEGRLQTEAMEKWKNLYRTFCTEFDFPFDPACVDPSRLMYLPRHEQGRPHETALHVGHMLDWRPYTAVDPAQGRSKDVGKTGPKTKTEAGKKLIPWFKVRANGFQIMDAIETECPDKVRSKASLGYNVECPFDELHTVAGDPTDQACFAANAAEGGNDFYIFKCLHGSCASYTSLDMLGKAIADGWMPESVLYDEAYDIVDRGPSPNVKASETKVEGDADKVASDLEAKIIALDTRSTDEEIESVIEFLLRAELSPIKRGQAEKAIAKKIVVGVGKVRTTIQRVRRKIGETNPPAAEKAVTGGKRLFHYDHTYDFEDAAQFCKAAILEANTRAKKPIVSMFDGNPVEMTFTPEGRAKFEEMTQGSFWAYLCSLVAFVKTTDEITYPPDKVQEDVAKYVYERCKSWLPASPTILYTPVFLPDGTLLDKPIYHFAPKRGLNHLLIYADGFKMPAIKAKPTLEDAQASVAFLRLEFMGDFPFCDQNENGEEKREPAEANGFAMLFTPAMRPMIPEPTPMFYVVKPKSGTGASFFAESVCLLHLGEATLGVDYCANEVELGKRVITQLMTGSPIVPFDDVDRMDSKIMHRLISAPKVGGRILGGMTAFEVPNNYTYFATGNNPITDDQMYRRIVWVRMNAKRSDPTKRDFRHRGAGGPSGLTFKQFCTQNRGEIISHVLTIIRYWIQAGKKPFTRKTNGSFPLWSENVGGVLQAVGIEGFMDEKARVKVSPQDLNDQAFMREWLTKYGFEGATNPLIAFEWAKAIGSVILRGKSDEEKKDNFLQDLGRLTDQTFPLKPVGGETADYEFKLVADADGGAAYSIIVPTDPNKKAVDLEKETAE